MIVKGQRLIRRVYHIKQAMAYHSVFVYGTLKTDEPNHKLLTNSENGHAKFISKARTKDKYPLVIASRYNVPFLLYKPGKGSNVVGEIYEVDNKMLEALDDLEDHPNLYEREMKDVKLDNGTETKSWIYFLKKFKPELLNETIFDNYSSNGSHGRQYLDRSQRDPNVSTKSQVYNNSNNNNSH